MQFAALELRWERAIVRLQLLAEFVEAQAHLLKLDQALLQADALKGKRIAVGAGSRGIDHIPDIVRAVVAVLKAKGAEPFIVPVMGNHGGSTAEGQQGILEGLGITEATVGAPIRPRMDTRMVGHTPAGTPVYVSEEALAADGVILVNRIKPLLNGQSQPVLGAALASLVSLFVVAHVAENPYKTKKLRDAVLDMHLATVRRLMPISEQMIHEQQIAVANETKARPN